MRKSIFYRLKANPFFATLSIVFTCSIQVALAQVSLTATGGAPTGTFLTVHDAFTAINAGTHTGTIAISINGNTTEPAAPVYLIASGQGAASYTSIVIKPTVTATISGATTPGSAVINMDGADNVTIDGSIAGTTRDLSIVNTALNTVANVACIRLVGRTTLGLGATNNTIKNCIITGSTTGNNGLSGSTVTTSFGIYAGSTTLTTMSATTGGADYDNLLIQNNLVTNAYIGINIIGLTANQADNLQILDNEVGSLSARVGFKGIVGQHVVGGSATNNVVRDIEATTSISVAGIDFAGSASNGFQILRNTIQDIHQYNTGGYGAYGVNITGGINYVIVNNVIHGVQTLNYAFSTTFNAFGIRITTGTGHQIYYNSVNMYGNYINTTSTVCFSAALCITSTAVTGLDIRNNVFANKITSNATTVENLAVNFASAYNFLNANLERNAYMVAAAAGTFVGKIGITSGSGNYVDLTAWRTISQVNNAANDVNSHPSSGNSNAPFTSDVNLVIPATTVTVLESTGLPIASLGLPNVDITNLNRPAFGGSAPDLGAYEFNGSQPGDLVPPVVSGVSATPGASCTAIAHTVTATATDNIGVTDVTLNYSFNGVAQTPITMSLSSGTTLNGTYTGVIPAAPSPNVLVTYTVRAADAGANLSGLVAGTNYTDNYLIVTASSDQTINTSVATTVSATTNDPSFGRLMISEVIQFKGGTGDGTYPAYIPTADNDFVELVNFGNVDMNAGGYKLNIYGAVNGSYTIPANTIIPSGATLVLAFTGTTVDNTNLYFGMNLGVTTSSTVQNGYVLRDAEGAIKDAVALNGYTFAGASGVTVSDWSGNIPSSSAGVRRTVATDNNVASDWTISSTTNLMNIGVFNTQITIVSIPLTITWTNSFNATTSTLNPLPVAGFASTGVYSFIATFNDGTCTTTDTVVITVVNPLPPVADFSATPLTLAAGGNVSFTDLTTNIPTSWTWLITPTTGVVYTGSTTASSQNPVVQFNNTGTYTVQLTASNTAGTDDTIRVQYITVNWCTTGATNGGDTDIGNITFGSLNNGTASPIFSNPTATGTYTDFTTLPAQSFAVGQSYPISISQITSGATFYSAHANVFIDYNNDGAFDPLTERVYNAATSDIGPISTVSGSVTIPLTATIGNVRMRVLLDENGSTLSSPCGTFAWGEAEDYIINIQCASTAPTSSTDTICAGNTATLTTSGTGINWYATAVSTTVLGTGTSFTTPILNVDTTYYATQTSVGCAESARTLFNILVNQSTTATQIESACGSYFWALSGLTYNASGPYIDTVPNAAGCDSIVTLDLTINQATSSSQTVTSCGPYTWAQSGITYDSSGAYSDTILNSTGCDSIVTLNLTINTLDLSVTNTSPTLTANEVGATYRWLDCGNGNAAISGATSAIYVATANGLYSVEVTKDNCTDTSLCETVANVGIDAFKTSLNVVISPNPSNDFVRVDFGSVKTAMVQVFDAAGKDVIPQMEIISGEKIDLRSLERGVYIVNVTSEGEISIKRIIKN